jgi:sporulation protein YlmC with PRC-barrel domain
MLRSVKDFEGYQVHATDGVIGTVSDCYFDDEHWAVRYLVVETGTFFSERKVLISPISFRHADPSTRQFHLALTQAKVKGSPGIELEKPISRQHERDYFRYYGWPYYWGYGGGGIWGGAVYPTMLAAQTWSEQPHAKQEGDDPHLRSAHEVVGYRIRGTDGEIGHVADLIVDDETWAIRYLVVDTRNWWLDNKVLVAPRWAERISWADHEVRLDLTRQKIKDSPAWSADLPVNREYEVRLYDYYGRPVYWQDEVKR